MELFKLKEEVDHKGKPTIYPSSLILPEVLTNLWQYAFILILTLFLVIGSISYGMEGVPIQKIFLYGLPCFLLVPIIWMLTRPFLNFYVVIDEGAELRISKDSGKDSSGVGECLLRVKKNTIESVNKPYKALPIYKLSFKEATALGPEVYFFSDLSVEELRKIITITPTTEDFAPTGDFLSKIPPEGILFGERSYLDIAPFGIARSLSFMKPKPLGLTLMSIAILSGIYSLFYQELSPYTKDTILMVFLAGFFTLILGKNQADVVLKPTSFLFRKGRSVIEVPLKNLSQVEFQELRKSTQCTLTFDPPTEFGSQIEFRTKAPSKVLRDLKLLVKTKTS